MDLNKLKLIKKLGFSPDPLKQFCSLQKWSKVIENLSSQFTKVKSRWEFTKLLSQICNIFDPDIL